MSENPDNAPVSENPDELGDLLHAETLAQLIETIDTSKGLLANPDYGRVQVRVTDEMKVNYDALNDEAHTWRQRAEEAEEVAADATRYREALEHIAIPLVHDAEAQTWIARAALGLDGEA